MKSPLIVGIIVVGVFSVPAIAATSANNEFELALDINRSALDESDTLAEEYENIRKQVSECCIAEHSDFYTLRKMIAVRQCVHQTMDRAVQKIDHDDLTSFHIAQRSE